MIERTRQCWQRRARQPLGDEDCRVIAANVSGFFNIVAEWAANEKDRKLPGTENQEPKG